MSKGLATLSINLEARLAELQAGFDKAARLAEKNASAIEARYAKLQASAQAVGAAFVGAAVVDRLAQFFRTTVQGIDALNDLADATGASVENLSALEDAAARTGTSFDTVGSALVRFNAELAGAREGSQTAEILQRIGLSAEELRRVDPAEALRRVSVGLAQYAEDGDKARAVQQLFGKSVAEVAPLLRDLAEVGQLNATVTTAQAEAVSKFNKQLAEFSKNATDLARDGLGPLLEGLNQLFDAVEGRGVGGFEQLGAAIRVPIQALSVFAANVEFTLRGIGTELGGLAAQGAALARLDFDAVSTIGEAMRDDAAAARREFDLLYARLMSIGQVFPQASYSNEGRNSRRVFGALPEPPTPGRGASRAASAAMAGFDTVDPLMRSVRELVDETDTQRLGQLQLQLQGLFELGGASPTPAIVEAIQKVGLAINTLTPGQQQLRANQARLDSLLGGTPSGQRQKVLDDIKLINKAYSDGAISVEAWAEAQVANTARLPKALEVQLEELSAVTKQFQANVQNVLGDNIASVLRGDFDSIEDAWKQMLLNMIAQATAADLATRLFGKDGRGGWAADLSRLVGGLFANGGAFSQGQPITAFADGGVLTKPTFFGMSGGRMGVAGEAGYEGILPLRRGPGGRLGVEAYGAGGGGGVTINVAGGMTRGEVMAAIQLAAQATEAKVMGNLRASRVL